MKVVDDFVTGVNLFIDILKNLPGDISDFATGAFGDFESFAVKLAEKIADAVGDTVYKTLGMC